MPEACLGLTVGTASFGPDSQNGPDGPNPPGVVDLVNVVCLVQWKSSVT